MARGFIAPVVAEFLQVPYATLDLWARSEFFVPSIAQAKGRGTRRLYSVFDVIILKVVVHLRNQGIHNDLIKNLIENMRSFEKFIMNGSKDQVMLANGQDVFELRNDIYEMIDVLYSGKPIWIIPIGRVKTSVMQSITVGTIGFVETEDSKVKVG